MANNGKTRGRAFEISPDKLTPYEKNSRIHSDQQVNMIADSIMEFGFLKPVLIDEKKMILAGHGAVKAAMQCELTKIPVRQISGLTQDQKRAYVIADNRSSELSKWDWELLTVELGELKSIDMDLAPVGFADFGLDGSHTRREHNVTIGGDRFLLQLEFEDEKQMQKVYDELHERGLSIKVLE